MSNTDNIDEVVAKALAEFASARELGEDYVRAIVAFKGCENACTAAVFEGWEHYDDIEDIIEAHFDIDDEMDNAINEFEENGEEVPDDDELQEIVYDHLSEMVMFDFEVIELCEYLEDGDGYLAKPL